MSPKQRVVVVGAGLAGVALARRLDRLGTPVIVLGEERPRPYNRVLLTEVLAGTYPPEVIALPSPERLRQGRVTRLDPCDRTVRRADGSVVDYHTLVLATGSAPTVPPLRGLGDGPELPAGLHPFHTLDDCLRLADAARAGRRVAIVGGGPLGVTAAGALAARGARVVVVERSPRLLGIRLDSTAEGLVRRHLARLGVEVRTSAAVTGVRTVDGALRAVETADGRLLHTRLAVLACGTSPRVKVAREAGLAVRRGVLVDDALRTSDPHVHALGDCAEHAGTPYGPAVPALEQAATLAALLSGDGGARYRGSRPPTRLTLPPATRTGTRAGAPAAVAAPRRERTGDAGRPSPARAPVPFDLVAFGEVEAGPGDHVVRFADATRGSYRKVVVRGDRPAGGVLVGDLDAAATLIRAWEAREPLPATGEDPLHPPTDHGGP
ncbi:FAD-dependent oxidoreductase [Streptomyces sp. ZYX-F-203]